MRTVTYNVQITKIEPNPKFDQEAWNKHEERQSRGGINNYYETPEGPTLQTRVLAVEITEAEWATIKQALIATWR